MYILETFNRDADNGSVAVEITPLGFCFKSVYIGCQSFIVPLLNFHEMQCVHVYAHTAEF